MNKKEKFYAIKTGRNVYDKIVNSWEECEKLVIGYPSIYKSFTKLNQAEKYLKNITPEEIEQKLIWNEIHKRNRIQDKFERQFGFSVPKYIIDEIILLEEHNTSIENLFSIINFAQLNNRITKNNVRDLKKYINRYIEIITKKNQL